MWSVWVWLICFSTHPPCCVVCRLCCGSEGQRWPVCVQRQQIRPGRLHAFFGQGSRFTWHQGEPGGSRSDSSPHLFSAHQAFILTFVVTSSAFAGFIRTDMTAGLKEADGVRSIPLGRFGEPEEVAQAVLFLLESPYITGQVLVVDGGLQLAT